MSPASVILANLWPMAVIGMVTLSSRMAIPASHGMMARSVYNAE